MTRFTGVIPALITPFDGRGDVDLHALERLVEFLLGRGVQGFYVCGSSGESLLLSEDERREVMKRVKEFVSGRAAVIAHVGCTGTRESIRLAAFAAELGLDAISSIPPIYFAYSQREIEQYYLDILQAVPLPLIVYNLPAMTGITFHSGNVAEIFRHDLVVGMKNTVKDLYEMQRLMALYPEKSIINGYDELFLSAMAVGAGCMIGSTVNFMPEKFLAMQAAVQSGNLQEAQRLQGEVNEIVALLSQVGVFKGIKAVLAGMGYPCGDCRQPFLPLNAEEMTKVQQILQLLKANSTAA